MPSTHQTGTSSTDYEDVVGADDGETFAEAAKMLATKNDATIKALVRGIRKPDRARADIRAEIALADHEDRDPRKKLIGMLNAKVSELTEGDE
jgi:hypothetical protein